MAGVEPHHFEPDCIDPGYRPRCRICGRERRDHPYIPPRRPK